MPKQEPERTCIVTRHVGSPGELMRFVLGPEGDVVPDLHCRLPGRGAWLTPTAEMVGQAVRRRAFPRAFKAEVKVSRTLAEEVDAALVRDLKGALALANKAGAVVTGFAKVEEALAKGQVAALIHAREAAEDGRRKLAAALRKAGSPAIYDADPLDDLSGDELDMVLGRSNVIHAALLAGPGGEGCLVRWRRLRAYRGVGGAAEQPLTLDKERPDRGSGTQD